MVAKQIIFIGNVQGVGFRYTARRIADNCGLTGYVRNLPNGSVEMFAQASKKDLDDCLEQIGEYFAGYIRDMKITELPQNPRYRRFEIKY